MENLKVDKKELKNELKNIGIHDFKKSHVLGEVYFMLSLNCDLRCRVCSWWGKKGTCRNKDFAEKQSSNLSLKDLKRFADQIIPYRPRTVTFSGGEPLLYRYWHPLAKYFKNKGIKVSLTTNGVNILKEFKEITETVDEINLSLGGPPSLLLSIRENPISHFTKILKGLKKINEFKSNNNRPRLRILYTISDLSYNHMTELINFMKKENIAIDQYYFQHLMFIDEKIFQKQKNLLEKKFHIKNLNIWKGYTYFPSGINFEKFKKEMTKLTKFNNVIFSPNLSFDEIKSYYQNNKGRISYRRFCLAPWLQLNILPNGDLYVCNDYFIGNIKKSSFKTMWNGRRIQNLRKYLTENLFPACRGCFNYYWERKI
jgi:MoaA/NifB/PqqE/SkfB family radical SAM enzyme